MEYFVLLFLFVLLPDLEVTCTNSCGQNFSQYHTPRDVMNLIQYLDKRICWQEESIYVLRLKTYNAIHSTIRDLQTRFDLCVQCDGQRMSEIERKLQMISKRLNQAQNNQNCGSSCIWPYNLCQRVECLRVKTERRLTELEQRCPNTEQKLQDLERRLEETNTKLTKLLNERKSAFDVNNDNGTLNSNEPHVDFRSEAADANDDFDIDGEDKYTTPCLGYYQFTIDISGEQNAVVALYTNGTEVPDTKLRVASDGASVSCSVIRKLDPNVRVDVRTSSNGIRAFVRFTGRLVFYEH